MNDTTYPICCIEHRGQLLYVELVQDIESRQRAWVRPLAMLDATGCHNLRNESDLVCPRALLRNALDVEVLPLLKYLNPTPLNQGARSQSDGYKEAASPQGSQFRRFIDKIYSDNPELFKCQYGA